jgi:hypothetical protein
LIIKNGDEIIISLNRLQNSSSTIMELWEEEEQREAVVNETFRVIRDAHCPYAWDLQPKMDELEEFRILANGSLFYTHPDVSESMRIYSPDDFCVVPMVLKFRIFV